MLLPFEAYEILGIDQLTPQEAALERVAFLLDLATKDQDLEKLALIQEAWETVKPYMVSWSDENVTPKAAPAPAVKTETRTPELVAIETVVETDSPAEEEEEDPEDEGLDVEELIIEILKKQSDGQFNITDWEIEVIKDAVVPENRYYLSESTLTKAAQVLEIHGLSMVLRRDILQTLSGIALGTKSHGELVDFISSWTKYYRDALDEKIKNIQSRFPWAYSQLKRATDMAKPNPVDIPKDSYDSGNNNQSYMDEYKPQKKTKWVFWVVLIIITIVVRIAISH